MCLDYSRHFEVGVFEESSYHDVLVFDATALVCYVSVQFVAWLETGAVREGRGVGGC